MGIIHVDETVFEALRRIVLNLKRFQVLQINLQAKADAARELAVDLEEEITRLARLLADLANAEKLEVPGPNETREIPSVITIKSANAARHLEAIQQPKGSFDFRIDFSAEPVRVPHLAGHLLLFLASGVPEDGRAGWRSKAEILDHLRSITGKTYRAQFVSQLVYFLRGKLGKYGSLVECNPQRGGWRFALRTGGPEHFVRTRLS
ncbi:MAG: hypothetical protein WCC27_19420, partial [Acidobacteriaceae bacterium]